MKSNILLFLNMFFLLSTGFSQSQFRIRVLESETNNPIEGALVFIEELPLGDQETDVNGQVVFQNVPTDRKVRVHVRKVGFEPVQEEIVASQTINSDNNSIITLHRVNEKSHIILWGYLYDINGKEVSNGKIDFNFAGRIFTTTSGNGGDYRIKIDKSEINGINSFRAIVKAEGCQRTISDKPIPQTTIENLDFRLNCNNGKEEIIGPKKESIEKLSGVWEMSLRSDKYLSPSKVIVRSNNEAKIGLELDFDGEIVTGKYLYVEPSICAEASILGKYVDGNLRLDITHSGGCCGSARMVVQASYQSDKLMLGTYEPSDYGSSNCNIWYASIVLKKK